MAIPPSRPPRWPLCAYVLPAADEIFLRGVLRSRQALSLDSASPQSAGRPTSVMRPSVRGPTRRLIATVSLVSWFLAWPLGLSRGHCASRMAHLGRPPATVLVALLQGPDRAEPISLPLSGTVSFCSSHSGVGLCSQGSACSHPAAAASRRRVLPRETICRSIDSTVYSGSPWRAVALVSRRDFEGGTSRPTSAVLRH